MPVVSKPTPVASYTHEILLFDSYNYEKNKTQTQLSSLCPSYQVVSYIVLSLTGCLLQEIPV